MRFLLLLLTALCLSLPSFEAAALAQPAGSPEPQWLVDDLGRTGDVDLSDLSGGSDLSDVVDGVIERIEEQREVAFAGFSDPPPGYCNIWSADLLDPLDLLDELEESSALFDVPTVRVVLPRDTLVEVVRGRASPPPSRFYKPPIRLS